MKNRRNTLKNKHTKKYKKNAKKMLKKRNTFRKKIVGGFLGLNISDFFKSNKEERRPVILGPEPKQGGPEIFEFKADLDADTFCSSNYSNAETYDDCIKKKREFYTKENERLKEILKKDKKEISTEENNPPVELPNSELEPPSQ